MTIKKRLIAGLMTAAIMCSTTIPLASALEDGRSNLPSEFTSGKVASASNFSNGVAVLKEDGSLWLSGKNGDAFFKGFTKVASNIQSYNISTGVLSILKNDNSLWKVDLENWKNENSFEKVYDDVVSYYVWPQNSLIVTSNHELWGWGYDLSGTYFPVDINSLPSSVVTKSQWKILINKPFKMMEDVENLQHTDDATLFLKTDGSVYGIGRNIHGQIGSSFSEEESATAPVKLISDVKKILPSNRSCMVLKNDNSLWTWGHLPWQAENASISTPIKLADNVASASEMDDSIAIVKTDGTVWTYGGITPEGPLEVGSTLVKAEIRDVAGVFGDAYNNECLAVRRDGSLWAWGGVSCENPSAGNNASDLYNYSQYGARLTDYLQLAGPDSAWDNTVTPATKPTIEATASASPSSAKVTVNGKQVTFDAYSINDNNYFKLRDIAKVLSGTEKQFEVTWNGESKSIELKPNTAYTAVGGELVTGKTTKQTAKLSSDTVYMNSSAASLTAYTINGNNYFKLRDLGKLLNFGVGWDNTTRTISIDTNASYTE